MFRKFSLWLTNLFLVEFCYSFFVTAFIRVWMWWGLSFISLFFHFTTIILCPLQFSIQLFSILYFFSLIFPCYSIIFFGLFFSVLFQPVPLFFIFLAFLFSLFFRLFFSIYIFSACFSPKFFLAFFSACFAYYFLFWLNPMETLFCSYFIIFCCSFSVF